MSHFTVMVVGDDVEGQLAPYDEDGHWFRQADGDPYEILGVPKDANAEQIEAAFLAKRHAMKIELGLEEEQDVEDSDEWYESRIGQAHSTLCDDEARAEYDVKGGRPASKWDWWVVGGRWNGFLLGKDGNPHDSYTKGGIDVETMRNLKGEKAVDFWDRYWKVVKDTPPLEFTWEQCLDAAKASNDKIRESGEEPSKPYFEIAREAYRSQPRMQVIAAHDEGKPYDQQLFDLFGIKPDDLEVGYEAFIQQQRDEALMTFAYVENGEWHGNGEMGWFGSSSGSDDVAFAREFNAWFDRLPDETLITIVDCHV